ncbi:MAG: PEP/pyruvate-binding domain-containing protein [Bacteroidota bacterium]
MIRLIGICSLFFISSLQGILAQEVPIEDYNVDEFGQVRLTINSQANKYYLLNVRHQPNAEFELVNSITLGTGGQIVITEPLAAYPLSHYQVIELDQNDPGDIDGDGIDDLTELSNQPDQGPLSASVSVDVEDGYVMVNNFATFQTLSEKRDVVQWSEFLNELEYVKFIISNFDDNPEVYFINTENHNLHADFGASIGIEVIGDNIQKGQISYHPTVISENGTFGTYAFNYSNGYPRDFEIVQRTQEILAANMPYLKNNLAYYVTDNSDQQYQEEEEQFNASRVAVLLEEDLFANVNFWGLNEAEGFGFFRHVALEDVPGPKDIVLYDALPNNLPRVAGIMTSIIQTPLSHVNLRAIQNNIPNAFVRDPLENDTIASLLNKYVYYKVEQSGFEIREATVDEVNAWFDNIRPEETQYPPLNLDYDSILPLESIAFEMYDGYGAKCANVATMRGFGFPEGTIPNGFGIPFYFYREFMEFNNFFENIENMIGQDDFINNRNERDQQLAILRQEIINANMPDWMYIALAEMQFSFPSGTSIRCRSSSNNEDLAGFNGAGLYDSKTHHPNEGLIDKTVKEIFASLWNLRAFEERDFYRIDHFTSSMAVLCHPNFANELVNGVGVSTDPIYDTENTFYLNSQLGEELITNPSGNSIPEEVLVDAEEVTEDGIIIVQNSNLVPHDSTMMSGEYLIQMREYLARIHQEFQILYDAEDNASFAMDIEYKIDENGQLIIKQARPWISFVPKNEEPGVLGQDFELLVYPNPTTDFINVQCPKCAISSIEIIDLKGRVLKRQTKTETEDFAAQIYLDQLNSGMYFLRALDSENIALEVIKFFKSNN